MKAFFAFYPTAKEKELAYYVKNDALPSINKDYIFSQLIDPVFQQSGENR